MTTLATATARTPTDPARARRVQGLAVAGALVGFALLVHLRDPHHPGALGICPLLALTGFYCPGCGASRAMRDLTDGNLREALGHNVLAVPGFIGMAAWSLWAILSRRVPAGPGVHPDQAWWSRAAVPLAVAASVVAVVFTVARNVPGSPLAP